MTGDVAPFCAGSLLMSPDDRRIDHEPFCVGTGGQGVENHLPDSLARPAAKAPMRQVPVAVFPANTGMLACLNRLIPSVSFLLD